MERPDSGHYPEAKMTYIGYLANLSVAELLMEYNAYNPAKKLKAWKRKRSDLEERIMKLADVKKGTSACEPKFPTKPPKKGSPPPHVPKPKAAPNGSTIGGLACSMLCKTYKNTSGDVTGLSYEQILVEMKNVAPDSNVSIASLRWYASKIKKGKGKFSGYLLPERRVRKKRTYETGADRGRSQEGN